MTRVMFTGPHGIGKSASAMKLAEALPDHLYIPSFAGPVAKRMGFDLNKPHTVEQMMAYQDRVLDTFIESYKTTNHVDTVYDRSPLDIAAYLVTGLKAKGVRSEPEYFHKAELFVKKCVETTRTYCDVLVYPEADLTARMENKYNRPTGAEYERQAFDQLIDYYVGQIFPVHKVQIIDVPIQFQYNDRINFILDEMGRNERV